jgi:hypothetical protein
VNQYISKKNETASPVAGMNSLLWRANFPKCEAIAVQITQATKTAAERMSPFTED